MKTASCICLNTTDDTIKSVQFNTNQIHFYKPHIKNENHFKN